MTRPWIRHLLDNFEDEVASVLLAAITVILVLQICTRYFLGDPLSWTEEVSRHLFVWLVFFGASGAIRDRSHIAVDVVNTLLPTRIRRIVMLGSNVLVLFFLINVLYWGARAVGRMWGLSTATLEIPFGLVYTVFPITATLMIIRTLVQMREDLVTGGTSERQVSTGIG
jgi:TRAP-type C4-dicarboxylate transport system permease small subunit